MNNNLSVLRFLESTDPNGEYDLEFVENYRTDTLEILQGWYDDAEVSDKVVILRYINMLSE